MKLLSQTGPPSSVFDFSRAFKILPITWKASGSKSVPAEVSVCPLRWRQKGIKGQSQLASPEVSHSLKQKENCTSNAGVDHAPQTWKEGGVSPLYQKQITELDGIQGPLN